MSACPACGGDLRPDARFCPACGAPTDAEVARGLAAAAASRRATARALQAIAIVFCGTLLALVLPLLLLGIASLADPTAYYALYYALLVPPASLALWRLGPGALRGSLAGGCAPGWLVLGFLLGPPLLWIGHVYVEALVGLLGGDGGATFPFEDPLTLWIVVAILPPLVEEYVDRGLLWEASRRILSPARTLLLTSLLFTFMHGLQGSYLSYPHRFLGGLVLGWLRLRSGSLLPGIAAHFTWNGTWVWIVTSG